MRVGVATEGHPYSCTRSFNFFGGVWWTITVGAALRGRPCLFRELAAQGAFRKFRVVDVHVIAAGVLDNVHDLFLCEGRALLRGTVCRRRQRNDRRSGLIGGAFVNMSAIGRRDLIHRQLVTDLALSRIQRDSSRASAIGIARARYFGCTRQGDGYWPPTLLILRR